MHGHALRRDPEPAAAVATVVPTSGAVAWIDHDRAVVACTESGGEPVLHELHREPPPGAPPSGPGAAPVLGSQTDLGPFLARVADEIGARDRVVILGPDAMRVELEREYVTIFRHPDRLVDVEDAPALDREELLGRLARITA